MRAKRFEVFTIAIMKNKHKVHTTYQEWVGRRLLNQPSSVIELWPGMELISCRKKWNLEEPIPHKFPPNALWIRIISALPLVNLHHANFHSERLRCMMQFTTALKFSHPGCGLHCLHRRLLFLHLFNFFWFSIILSFSSSFSFFKLFSFSFSFYFHFSFIIFDPGSLFCVISKHENYLTHWLTV